MSEDVSSGTAQAGPRELQVARAFGCGDVRARRRHLADECLDLRSGQGPRHDGERGPVGDRPRGSRLGRVHPDQQQGGRPRRSQAGLRPGPARLRHRRPGDDAGPGPDHHHHLLGDSRRPGGLVAAARHAVTDPRELRGRRPQEDLRPGRGCGGDCRSSRAAPGRFRHHLSVVAGGVRPRSRGHRGGARQHQAGPRREVHGASTHRPGWRGSLRRGDGRCRPGHPGLAGGRRSSGGVHRDRPRRARRTWVLAGARQAPGQADVARPGSVPLPALQDRHLAAADAADHPRRRHDRAPDLLADDARVQRDAGRALVGPLVAQHVRGGPGGGTGLRKASLEHHRVCGVRPDHGGNGPGHPAGASGRLRLVAHRPPAVGGLRVGPVGVPARTTTRWRPSRRTGSARLPE